MRRYMEGKTIAVSLGWGQGFHDETPMNKAFMEAAKQVFPQVHWIKFFHATEWEPYLEKILNGVQANGQFCFLLFATHFGNFKSNDLYFFEKVHRAGLIQRFVNQGYRVIAFAMDDDEIEIDGIKKLSAKDVLYFKCQISSFNPLNTCIIPGIWSHSNKLYSVSRVGEFLETEDSDFIFFLGSDWKSNKWRNIERNPDRMRQICEMLGWKFYYEEVNPNQEFPLRLYHELIGKAAAVWCPRTCGPLAWRHYEVPALGGLPLISRPMGVFAPGHSFTGSEFLTYTSEFELTQILIKLRDNNFRRLKRHEVFNWYLTTCSISQMVAYYIEKIYAWHDYSIRMTNG